MGTPVKSQMDTPVKSQMNTPVKSQMNTPVKSQVNTPVRSQTNSMVKTHVKTNKYKYDSSSSEEESKMGSGVESIEEPCKCETCMAKYQNSSYVYSEPRSSYETIECTNTNLECTKVDSRSECDCEICAACKTLQGTGDLIIESPKKSVKEPSKESAKEIPKESIKESVKGPRKDLGKEVKEIVRESTKEITKDPVKELPKKSIKEILTEPLKEPVSEVLKLNEFKSGKESLKEVSKPIPKEPIKNIMDNISKDIGKKLEDSPNEIDKSVPNLQCDNGCPKRQFGGLYTYAATGRIGTGGQTLYQEVGVVNFVRQGLDTFKSKAIINGTTVIDVTMTCSSVLDSSAHTVTSTCIRTDSSGSTINNFQIFSTYGETGNVISFEYLPNASYPSPYNVLQVQGTASR
jgi:hypothetical protein